MNSAEVKCVGISCMRFIFARFSGALARTLLQTLSKIRVCTPDQHLTPIAIILLAMHNTVYTTWWCTVPALLTLCEGHKSINKTCTQPSNRQNKSPTSSYHLLQTWGQLEGKLTLAESTVLHKPWNLTVCTLFLLAPGNRGTVLLGRFIILLGITVQNMYCIKMQHFIVQCCHRHFHIRWQ